MTQELMTLQAGEVTTAEVTFWTIVDQWLEELKTAKKRQTRTLEAYRYNMGVFKKWLDAQGIVQATRQDVKNWNNAMEANGWKPATRNAYLATVRSFYKWLNEEHDIDNIAIGISGWQDTKEHKRGFLAMKDMKKLLAVVEPTVEKRIADKKEELEKKKQKAEQNGKTFNYENILKHFERIAHLQGIRDKSILAALMVGGLRTVEISRLRIVDLTQDGGACVLNVLGKGRNERETVKISRKTEALIQDWLAAREAVDTVSGKSPLFCSLGNNSFGEPITSLSVSRLCKEYLRAAGLNKKQYQLNDDEIVVKPVTAHSLRGSCATNAFLAGAPLDKVKQQLRHRNLATTQIYLEEAEKFKNPVADLISDGIF